MIDLHTHTSISDGTLSPKELIQLAKETGLTAVAITDHDSIAGYEEAQSEADKLGVNFIKGIEFSVSFGDKRLIHILGLDIDEQRKGFMELYTHFRQRRSNKLDFVFEKLQAMGVSISYDAVLPFVTGGYMDRQAVAKYMVANGYAEIVKYAWINYLDKIDYIDGELMTPEEAFDAIHAAGGKAFLAHFHLNIGLKGYSDLEQRALLLQLKNKGLDGMEYYYPSFSDEDKQRCAELIKAFDFIKTGGSDFHGANRAHIKLGVGEGDFHVPDELLDPILEKRLNAVLACREA